MHGPGAVSFSSWMVPRVRRLKEVIPETLRQALDTGADLLPAGEFDVNGGDSPHGVLCEKRTPSGLSRTSSPRR
jgi:hypothetical protein